MNGDTVEAGGERHLSFPPNFSPLSPSLESPLHLWLVSPPYSQMGPSPFPGENI